MAAAGRFSDKRIETLRRAKILGLRAGSKHKYTAVWPVVVEGRLFVRTWNDSPDGWFRAFLAESRGVAEWPEGEARVVGKPVRSERMRKAVTAAYAEKYATKASQKWVQGFAEPAREANTLELTPA